MPTLDLIRAGGSGAVEGAPRAEFLSLSGSGPLSILIDPLNDIGDQEPYNDISITAKVTGYTPNSFTWRRISGPPVTLNGTGATVTFKAPGTVDGGVLIVGVTATVGAQTTVEETLAISILPAQVLARVDAGSSTWVAGGLKYRD